MALAHLGPSSIASTSAVFRLSTVSPGSASASQGSDHALGHAPRPAVGVVADLVQAKAAVVLVALDPVVPRHQCGMCPLALAWPFVSALTFSASRWWASSAMRAKADIAVHALRGQGSSRRRAHRWRLQVTPAKVASPDVLQPPGLFGGGFPLPAIVKLDGHRGWRLGNAQLHPHRTRHLGSGLNWTSK